MTKSLLCLASASQSRQTMLMNAGLKFDIMPAHIDEEIILKNMQQENNSVEEIAYQLAKEKSLYISKECQEKYVIGSDQILSLDNKSFSKAKNREEAKDKLLELQGKTHQLTSSVCVSKDNKIIWQTTDTATLKIKSLDESAIDHYITKAGDDVYNCVGCYALEGVGIQLFEEIKGDYFTILGMPLLPLLNFLESEGLIS